MRALLFLLIVLFCGCAGDPSVDGAQLSNAELERMVAEDQRMRTGDSNGPMEPQDKVHRKRVMELLAENAVNTPEDKFNAALILQHTGLSFCNGELTSMSAENYYLAYCLAKISFESGNRDAAYMVAATYDRYLLFTEGYQKFGTQKIMDDDTGSMVWAPIDTITSDAERAEFGVKPKADLLEETPMKPWPQRTGRSDDHHIKSSSQRLPLPRE